MYGTSWLLGASLKGSLGRFESSEGESSICQGHPSSPPSSPLDSVANGTHGPCRHRVLWTVQISPHRPVVIDKKRIQGTCAATTPAPRGGDCGGGRDDCWVSSVSWRTSSSSADDNDTPASTLDAPQTPLLSLSPGRQAAISILLFHKRNDGGFDFIRVQCIWLSPSQAIITRPPSTSATICARRRALLRYAIPVFLDRALHFLSLVCEAHNCAPRASPKYNSGHASDITILPYAPILPASPT
ncbi:hypothetical protein BDZ89DRAFT_1055426, partial [Hymenopellis radicata]